MSSRNRYLSPDDRARAPRLQAALQAVREAFAQGEREARQLRAIGMRRLAEDAAIGVDYLEVIDPVPFVPVELAEAGSAVILAARVGGTRLLDNVIL